MRTVLALLLFVAVAAFCYELTLRSWGGGVYVYLGEERAPAAVRTMADYSELKSGSLYKAAHLQLLAEAEIEKRDGFVGVHLGNPLLRLEDGTSGFACKVRGREGLFDRVELVFDGTGISVAGESARMTVDAPCEALNEATLLSTVWIPMQDLISGKPIDADYKYGDNNAMNISLQNMPGEWPPTWVLTSVRVFRGDKAFTVDQAKMRESRSAMLSFEAN